MTILIHWKNPLGIKQPGRQTWRGSGQLVFGEKENDWQFLKKDKRSHAVFCHELYCFRAGCRILANFMLRHNCDTLAKITERYAPSLDTQGSVPGGTPNKPSDYARFLAQRCDIQWDEPFSLFYPDGAVSHRSLLKVLLRAIAEYENYAGYTVSESALESGIAMYERDYTNH